MNARYLAFVVLYFAVQSVACVVLALMLPWTLLFDPVRRRAMYSVFFLANRIAIAPFWAVRVTGTPFSQIKGPAVFVCNHQSLWDHVFSFLFEAFCPRVMMKADIFWYPVIGPLTWMLGMLYVKFGRKNAAFNARTLEKGVRLLRAGASIFVFPEGTRRWKQAEEAAEKSASSLPVEAGLGEFRNGAFQMARDSGASVVPLVFESRHLVRDSFDAFPGVMRAHVLPPVDPNAFPDVESLRNSVRSAMLAAMVEIHAEKKKNHTD